MKEKHSFHSIAFLISPLYNYGFRQFPNYCNNSIVFEKKYFFFEMRNNLFPLFFLLP